jgi:hypothetical protein
MIMISLLLLGALLIGWGGFVCAQSSEAIAACKKLNLTMQLTMMRGYGPIANYSRNSGPLE